MKIRGHLFAIASAMVVLALLYWSLRGINWRTVAQTIASVQPRYVAIAFAIGLVATCLRAARWRILVEAQAPVSYAATFWAMSAGYFGNNFLPARAGELVRSKILSGRSGLSTSFVLATALAERISDAVALVALGALMSLWVPSPFAVRGSFALVGFAGVLALICAPLVEQSMVKILARWPRLQTIAAQALLGFRSLHSWRRLPAFAVLTVCIWLVDATATSTLAMSLSVKLPVPAAMLLLVGLGLSSALPSTPGNIGVYQFVAVMVLKPLGIPAAQAMAFSLFMQALNYVVTSVLGLIAVTWFARINWPAFRQQALLEIQLEVQPSQIQS